MEIALNQPETLLWVTDLQEIERRSEANAEVNLRFAEFLKTQNSTTLDQRVRELSQNVAKEINCTTCANCCKSLTVAIQYPDMEKLAISLGLQIQDFKSQFMKKDLEGQMVLKKRPCPMLRNNLCSVYNDRPSTCRTYPHLEKDQFISRIGNVLSNLKVCPIAYNTFELLKLNFE